MADLRRLGVLAGCLAALVLTLALSLRIKNRRKLPYWYDDKSKVVK
jgi:hypothetical protein